MARVASRVNSCESLCGGQPHLQYVGVERSIKVVSYDVSH